MKASHILFGALAVLSGLIVAAGLLANLDEASTETLIIGAPLLGWVLMVLDYRAYLRSLRRALTLIGQYAVGTPAWSLQDRPECLQELGLTAPCTREEVLAAYRQRVKTVHPDHGGDRRRFEILQRRLEEALLLAEGGQD